MRMDSWACRGTVLGMWAAGTSCQMWGRREERSWEPVAWHTSLAVDSLGLPKYAGLCLVARVVCPCCSGAGQTRIQRTTNGSHLPIPIASLRPIMQRTSNKLSVERLPSPCRRPPLTPRACFGMSTTRFATPSTPGWMMYSGPRNDTEVSVSDSCSGFWVD